MKSLMKEGTDVLMSEETTMFLLDVSGSMDDLMGGSFSDFAGDKISALKKAIKAVLQERLDHPTVDKMGAITFGGHSSEVLFPPASPSQGYLKLVDKISTYGGTPMYQALEMACDELELVEGLVRLVLVTDGEPNEGYGKSDVIGLVEKIVEEYGFVLDTVGVGTELAYCYDENFLKKLADLGGGTFYPVTTASALMSKFLEMARERRLLLGGGIKLLQAKY